MARDKKSAEEELPEVTPVEEVVEETDEDEDEDLPLGVTEEAYE